MAGTDPTLFDQRLATLQLQLAGNGLGLTVELRLNDELNGAAGAYTAFGPTGGGLVSINADWISNGASALQIHQVLLEYAGQSINQHLNRSLDSLGNGGELFAKRLIAPILGTPRGTLPGNSGVSSDSVPTVSSVSQAGALAERDSSNGTWQYKFDGGDLLSFAPNSNGNGAHRSTTSAKGGLFGELYDYRTNNTGLAASALSSPGALVQELKLSSQDNLRTWAKRFDLLQAPIELEKSENNLISKESTLSPQNFIEERLGADPELSVLLLNALLFGSASLYIINKSNPGMLKDLASSLWGSQSRQTPTGNRANKVIAVFLMRSTTALDSLIAVELRDDAIEILAEEKLFFRLDTAAQRHRASFDIQLKKLCLKLDSIGLPAHELLLLDPELQSALSTVEHLGRETKIMEPTRLGDVVEQLSTTEINQLQAWLTKPGVNPLNGHPIKSNLQKRQNELEHELSREKANMSSLIELSLAMGLRQPAISLV
jgi:hypothetical protein